MLKIEGIWDSCTGCLACMNICPRKAIESHYDTEGFIRPTVNHSLCVECHSCEKVCHVLFQYSEKPLDEYHGLIARSLDADTLLNSSSGGLFHELAQWTINNGGVVFAATYDYDKMCLKHSSTDELPLLLFQKSKYIESDTGNTFSRVYKSLMSGRSTLFCGTPCQVSGLRTFLQMQKCPMEQLILVDFFCHGVPSSIHFAEWVSYLSKRKLKGDVTSVDFRNKDDGWFPYNVVYKSAIRKIQHPYYEDLISAAFYDNLALRRSCSNCREIFYHNSDLTLGDYRGPLLKEFNTDNKGLSLIVVNTNQGEKVLSQLRKGGKIESSVITQDDFKYAYHHKNEDLFSLAKRDKNYRMIDRYGYNTTLLLKYGFRIALLKTKRWIKTTIKGIR